MREKVRGEREIIYYYRGRERASKKCRTTNISRKTINKMMSRYNRKVGVKMFPSIIICCNLALKRLKIHELS